ncbi:hypothetical protein [Cylindrospermum sp. FACHB-282]|uniref:hypothetical protein n=1 Tax=Cylindrospermum sp. FACHB-282 TaxID=2692794 RepID=UPI0016827608|nr:hypothetical protein [Cylindrospermum sp. FACHB-282]MBD2386011.1 hypothetical protein [Cylindrospermum sp. FACHB-282]
MGIKLVTKSEQQVIEIAKRKATLLDAIRVMSWEQYKLNKPDYERGIAGYNKEFGDDWKSDNIHKKSLDELVKFVATDLGFTVDELLQYRKNHYSEKSEIKARVAAKNGNVSVSVSTDFGYPPEQMYGETDQNDFDEESGYPPY